jgi:hypothetical protein
LFSWLLSKNIKIRIYKTIILPLVLHGHETWSLTLREEHRLGVFENRVLRRIFGPRRNKVIGGWRCSRQGEKGNSYRILAGMPEGKRPLGRPRFRLKDRLKWVVEI